MTDLREKIIATAKEEGADTVCMAPASRFPADDPIFAILPEVKTVICLAFRVLRGVYRGIEEGTTYYQYSTMGVETMEETVMPIAALRVANLIEQSGAIALPQRRHHTVVAAENETNPEATLGAVFCGRAKEVQMHFADAAVLCGLGERGLHGAVLTEEFGPMVRYCFILTDAVLPTDAQKEAHLCDRCGACVAACPGHAISADGRVDNWRCAVYYDGACGLQNPFMPPDAYADFEDRLTIIAGTANITPERAREIIMANAFYPPMQQGYNASICGRACDRACYVHLEEKGLLSRHFKTPFRKEEPWTFKIEDFQ